MSSEEKLLKLIRRKSPLSAFKPEAVKAEGQVKPASSKQDDVEKKGIDALVFLNRIFVVAIIVLTGYLIFHWSKISKIGLTSAQVSLKKNIENDPVMGELEGAVERPFEYYQGRLANRDLFTTPWDKAQTQQINVDSNNSDLASWLKVVGIVLDGDPKVIVEDLQNNQTHFLSKGDMVNNAVLKEIEDSRVIFSFNGREVELNP